ncbi:polysaccharide lyase 8 family protein [Kribbella deserti]|uniref:Polysaccharide lyase 8 family protein n=1 Tax=Kribbella deserti TaxID=1926257 RepID=A0ABV6QXW2_9ACTN
MRRRTFLAGSTAAVTAFNLGMPAFASATPADFAGLRAKWAADLTGGTALDPADPDYAAALTRLDNAATTALARLDRTTGRTRVFLDQDLKLDPAIPASYVRLEQLATAWATRGSRYFGDASLLSDVLAGLESMYQLIYKPGTVEFGNWWSWEIGATRPLANTMVLLYAQIPAEARQRYCAAIDHFVPDPYWMFPPERGRIISTGANRVDLCQAVIVRALVTEDEAKLTHARDGLSDTWQYVTSGDGFYRDGSFVQHTYVAYTGTYGHVLLSGIGKLLALLANSPWAITDPKRQILFDSVAKAYLPVVHDLRMMDFVRGRALSRSNASDHNDGYTAAEAILRLAQGVEPALAAKWRAAVAGWLARDTFGNMLSGATIPRVSLVKSLRASGVTPAPEPDGHTLFAGMDRSVHRRNGWAFAISMASRRIAYYESGNGENEQGYHTGSGMTYLYDRDNGQYADAFWPTVDRYRLPGITVDRLPLPPKAGGEWGEARPPSATWVGGSTLDGYAAVGQHLEGPVSPMRARKSWFCFDEYVVALGAGITGSSGHAVETVVENRNLHASGTNALLVDGVATAQALGEGATVAGARWAHLDGVCGYVFPNGSNLKVLREARTGAWRDVNTGGSTTPITRRYLTMWLDHGVDPRNASYGYLVAPGASADRTKQLARSSGLMILRNTADAQAVVHPTLGLAMTNFWKPGSVADVVAETPCSVIQRWKDNQLHLAISDPTQLSASVRLRLVLPGFRLVRADDGVTARRTSRGLEITVDVTGAAGASKAVVLSR